jgi:creatinine amidohydrolase
MAHPWRLNELTPSEVQERLAATGRLIVPAGTLESRGPHLPLGTDTIILERLADDLSARTGVVRTPALPFGARGGNRRGPMGTAGLSRKALHRVVNELIAAWEEDAGVREVHLLTAHAAEPHQEALGAVRAIGTVRVVDIFGLDFRGLLARPDGPLHGGELDTSLMIFIRPELVTVGEAVARYEATADKGRRLYGYILDRLTALCCPPSGVRLEREL